MVTVYHFVARPKIIVLCLHVKLGHSLPGLSDFEARQYYGTLQKLCTGSTEVSFRRGTTWGTMTSARDTNPEEHSKTKPESLESVALACL